MITPPSFRYFRDPHHFSSYRDTGEVCPFCGLVRPGYGGGAGFNVEDHEAVYDEHYSFICEICLLDGQLKKMGLLVDEGEKLRLDIRVRHPELSEAEAEMLAQQRTTEIEQRTPRIKDWPLFHWATHCGDFCCYIKEAGQLDMHRLALDGDGRTFFDSLLDADIWERLRPDAPEDSSVKYHVGLYLFQCWVCGKYRVGYRLG